MLWMKGLSDGWTLSVRDSLVIVEPKRKSREKQLEEMVRLLALHVDDEDLYDRARALVKTI
jgi:hypothetical protein